MNAIIKARWLPSFFAYLSIGITCLLVMLPRIQSPQFGLLDDAAIMMNAQTISEEPLRAFSLMADFGRYLPGYLFFQTIIYNLVGPWARKWFLVYFLVLLFESLGIYLIVRLRGFSRWQAWFAGMLFCLSGPIIECFYTLSKAEILVVGWYIFALVALGLFTKAKAIWKRMIFLLFTTTGLLFSMLSKETALVIIGILAGWAILSRILPTSEGDFLKPTTSTLFFVLSLVAGVIFYLLFTHYIPLGQGQENYASKYSLESITLNFIYWAAYFIRDFAFIVPLILLICIPSFRKTGLLKASLEQVIWIIGWFIILVPWKNIHEYYLLPLAVGSSIFGGLIVGRAIEKLSSNNEPSISRIACAILLGFSLFLFQFSLGNIITTARTQLLYDRENSDMLKNVSHLPEQANVMLNIQVKLEYYETIVQHLHMFRNRSDIVVKPFSFQGIQAYEPGDYYVVTPLFNNQSFPSVRNSLTEREVSKWNQSLHAFLNGNAEVVYNKSNQIGVINVGIQQVLNPVAGFRVFAAESQPVIDGRFMSYGWSIYHVQIDPLAQSTPGVYKPTGEWRLRNKAGKEISITTREMKGQPVVGDLNGDSWSDIGLFQIENQTFHFETDLNGDYDIAQTATGMLPGDIPFMGDWDGNGQDTPGFFRPKASQWFFYDSSLVQSENTKKIIFGESDCLPVTGDWNGDRRDEFGVYCPDDGEVSLALDFNPSPQEIIRYVAGAGKQPVSGDWYGFGMDTLAFVGDGQWCFQPYNGSSEPANQAKCLPWETNDGIPVAGRWKTE